MEDNSILTSTKKVLNIPEDITQFDQDILMHINSVLSTLTQEGVGKEGGLIVTDATAKWGDFVPMEDGRYQMIKSYVPIRVRLVFDPPESKTVVDSLREYAHELEYRMYTQAQYDNGGY